MTKNTATTKSTATAKKATTKAQTTAKPKAKKFNPRTATKPEFDREVKRLASAVCLARQEIKKYKANNEEAPQELVDKFSALSGEYYDIRQAKAKKFPGRKTYMDMTQAEIDAMDLKETMAAIASLHSKKSRYPEQTDKVMKKMGQYMAHKGKLQHEAEAREMLKGMSKAEIEALLK